MIHCKELDIYSNLGVRERTIMAALTALNRVKKTTILMSHYDDSEKYNGGVKIDIESKDMMWPAGVYLHPTI